MVCLDEAIWPNTVWGNGAMGLSSKLVKEMTRPQRTGWLKPSSKVFQGEVGEAR